MADFPKKDSFDLIAFDLDNTLAPSKSAIDADMADLLCRLLKLKRVAIISGDPISHFEKNFFPYMNLSAETAAEGSLKNLSIMPTQGACLYEYADGKWQPIYQEIMSDEDRKKILSTFDKVLSGKSMNNSPIFERPQKIYGILVEDRGSQVTFSGLGSEAPLQLKQKWDPDRAKRTRIIEALKPLLPDFTVNFGGSTSIDVIKKGIDKAYGIRRLSAHLNIPLSRIIYVGDTIFPEGNDFAVVSLGIVYFLVKSPADSKQLIHSILTSTS